MFALISVGNVVRHVVPDILEAQLLKHRHGDAGDVLLSAHHMPGADQGVQPLFRREAVVFRKDGHPVVQTGHSGLTLPRHLLQLGGDLHHHGLQLLLFQLQRGQIPLELLQAILLHL